MPIDMKRLPETAERTKFHIGNPCPQSEMLPSQNIFQCTPLKMSNAKRKEKSIMVAASLQYHSRSVPGYEPKVSMQTYDQTLLHKHHPPQSQYADLRPNFIAQASPPPQLHELTTSWNCLE
uniref:Uncharacterized protein n=1 Tax=Eutreptiella gymnastica TaxID=73025 RepID=A0A7S1HUQ0_9EUGL|mmetsp:Transcript_107162/g.184841  ORF Transcript_107162/g.184841 Transcript_107162/m.184841 type:complete len:121 (+) Transcript_107162:116-478(+)